MNHGSTLILKGVIYLIALAVLAICTFALPSAIRSDNVGYYRPLLLGLYIPAIPFFIALSQGLKLLSNIDANAAFSPDSVSSLKTIKQCGFLISVLFTIGMPYIYMAGERDDAPGVILLGLVIIFASFVIATFAAVLEKLIHNAVDIKSENDLTV